MAAVAKVHVGAGTAKAVIFADGEIVAYSVRPTGYDLAESARKTVEEALEKANVPFNNMQQIVSLGYSRNLVPFPNKAMTEIMCHARGANFLVPQARTVIDTGCQDNKVIKIDQSGIVSDFFSIDKFVAGTGRFIEAIAQALELSVAEVGPVALTSENYCNISSTCTVFAETEIISQRARGGRREDLIAGDLRAIANRVSIMASNVGLVRGVVSNGGVAKNISVKRALEETCGIRYIGTKRTSDYRSIAGSYIC